MSFIWSDWCMFNIIMSSITTIIIFKRTIFWLDPLLYVPGLLRSFIFPTFWRKKTFNRPLRVDHLLQYETIKSEYIPTYEPTKSLKIYKPLIFSNMLNNVVDVYQQSLINLLYEFNPWKDWPLPPLPQNACHHKHVTDTKE